MNARNDHHDHDDLNDKCDKNKEEKNYINILNDNTHRTIGKNKIIQLNGGPKAEEICSAEIEKKVNMKPEENITKNEKSKKMMKNESSHQLISNVINENLSLFKMNNRNQTKISVRGDVYNDFKNNTHNFTKTPEAEVNFKDFKLSPLKGNLSIIGKNSLKISLINYSANEGKKQKINFFNLEEYKDLNDTYIMHAGEFIKLETQQNSALVNKIENLRIALVNDLMEKRFMKAYIYLKVIFENTIFCFKNDIEY